jgi:hypothetical protein
VLKWARENDCPWDACTCAYAAKGGHLEVLRWARENGCPWDEMTCTNAAACGHLEVLQWACANGCRWDGWTRKNTPHLYVWNRAVANGATQFDE